MPHSPIAAGIATLLVGAVLLLTALDPVAAQEPEGPAEAETLEDGAATPAPAAPPPPEVPYDDRLLRLSEIVGSVHYLQTLCRAEAETDSADASDTDEVSDDADWRDLMEKLIAAEAPEAPRNARLTAAFNRGYRSFASVYTSCTPAAEAARARYRSEGATLASEIIARFGN